MFFPVEDLKDWFACQQRALPWRQNRTPYSVWISEIMLQQTQVAVVIPYFERWMRELPTIATLAKAPIEKVLKLWEGLGYYSRARHLHQAAQYVLSHHMGELPQSTEELKKIKGLGPYTIGAIQSFAFFQKTPAVDANVMRVLARYYGVQEEIAAASVSKKIWEHALALLPEEKPWIVNEALIELGALVCKKDPCCSLCPLRQECVSYRNGWQKEIPRKKKRQPTITLRRLVGVIEYENSYLVQKGEKGKIMSDLFEFPYIEVEKEITAAETLVKMFSEQWNLSLTYFSPLPLQKHAFTRYQVYLYPHYFKASSKNHCQWEEKERLAAYPFSSGHRRVLQTVL